MKTLLLTFFVFTAMSFFMSTAWARTTAIKQSPTYGIPWIPEVEFQSPLLNIQGINWMQKHQSFVNNTRVNGSKINVLFLGDSLTYFYGDQGKAVWQQVWEPLGGTNYGIAGDRTEHVLWRITNGEITGLHPKVVVMMIGINNVWCNKTETDIARGVATIVGQLRKSLPTSKILLLSNTPGFLPDSNPPVDVTPVVERLNKLNSKLDDGKNVRFLDVMDVFYNNATRKERSERFVLDRLHYNEEGYISLYQKMWPMVRELMGKDGQNLPQKPKAIVRMHPVDSSLATAAKIRKLPGGKIDWVKMCTSTRTH